MTPELTIVPALPLVATPLFELQENVPLLMSLDSSDIHSWDEGIESVPLFTSERSTKKRLLDESVPAAADAMTVAPAPDIVPPDHDSSLDTSSVPEPVNPPPVIENLPIVAVLPGITVNVPLEYVTVAL